MWVYVWVRVCVCVCMYMHAHVLAVTSSQGSAAVKSQSHNQSLASSSHIHRTATSPMWSAATFLGKNSHSLVYNKAKQHLLDEYKRTVRQWKQIPMVISWNNITTILNYGLEHCLKFDEKMQTLEMTDYTTKHKNIKQLTQISKNVQPLVP